MAHPTTLTGSIGIFGMLPNYARALRKYTGVTVDGVSTGALAAEIRVDTPLSERARAHRQAMIEHGYRRFLQTVASAREMSVAEVDTLAQGRVWSGSDAHAQGLIDKLGGLDDAIASAASNAGLEEGYRVHYRQPSDSWRDRLVGELLGEIAGSVPPPTVAEPWLTIEGLVTRTFAGHAAAIAALDDPDGMYAYAMLEVD
ncbi:MAG: S49 family peptidase [Myxococcota bacterium]